MEENDRDDKEKKVENSENLDNEKENANIDALENLADEKEKLHLKPPSEERPQKVLKKRPKIEYKDTLCELITSIIFVILFICLALYFIFSEKLSEEQLINKYPTDPKANNYDKPNQNNEALEKHNYKEKEICDEGNYVPKGHIHCIPCSVENCAECKGHRLRDHCLSCKKAFIPIYNKDKEIEKCTIETCNKGPNEKCLSCLGVKCGACNKGYKLVNGECLFIHSFKSIYKTNHHKRNILLINERYNQFIEEVIVDGHHLTKPSYNYTFEKPGTHTVLMRLKTDKLDSGKKMFFNATNLISISFTKDFKTGKMISMRKMFKDCINLKSIDFSQFDSKGVNDFSYAFDNCSSLENINFANFQTTNAKFFNSMFSNCKSLKSLSLKSFITIKALDMREMFLNCSSLTSIDLTHFNTENTEYMLYMFSGCSSLKQIDVSSFRTDKVKDISYMFKDCSSLKSIDLKKFNSIKVTNMEGIFEGCGMLNSIDLSNFHTDNLKNVNKMFFGCNNLQNIDISHIKILSWNKGDRIFNSKIGKNGKIVVRRSFLDKIKDNIPSGWKIIKSK